MIGTGFEHNFRTEAESKEKHGVWDPMPELTITSPYVEYSTFIMGNPMPESTLSPSMGLRIWPLINFLVVKGVSVE
jgi:hypothetical protein